MLKKCRYAATRGRGEIGRRAGFRFLWETMGVQVPSSAPQTKKRHLPLFCLVYVHTKGIDGGGASGSERFAVECLKIELFTANCISPVGCAPGRVAIGASPFVRTKKSVYEQALTDRFFIACFRLYFLL